MVVVMIHSVLLKYQVAKRAWASQAVIFAV